MSESIATAADATAELPEGESPVNGLKRRQSESSEPDAKRQKAELGKNAPKEDDKIVAEESHGQMASRPHRESLAHNDRATVAEPRRKSGAIDEKQRSKRLFGSFLGNLNQGGDRLSKRRQEIESRRKAELQRQDDERAEDKQKGLERLRQHRSAEQEKVNEQNMRTRHGSILQAAEYLQTESTPKLYYRPWDLRAREKDQIDEQSREAEAQIDRELAAFERAKGHEASSSGAAGDMETDVHGFTVTASHTGDDDSNAQERLATETAGTEAAVADSGRAESSTEDQKAADIENSQPSSKSVAGSALPVHDKDIHDFSPAARMESIDDDHVVEGEEDTVIY